MLQRVEINGIQLPRLYVAENNADVKKAMENGIPYVKWKDGVESLIRTLLRPALEKMFPHISWNKVLGKRRNIVNTVVVKSSGHTTDENNMFKVADYDREAMISSQLEHDKVAYNLADQYAKDNFDEGEVIEDYSHIATSDREIPANNNDLGYDHYFDKVPIDVYIGDLSSSVDIEVLMKLGMLPTFLGDITDCIRTNISNSMMWTEGYTKKLGATLGNFNRKQQLPNLIILDISNSIPDGIAATMVTLIETLRSQCEADLIITSARSGYYPAHSELPSPQTIFDYYGRSNEGAEFMAILEQYIAGREFGHVISFGDNDNPSTVIKWSHNTHKEFAPNLMDTKIHAIHHYHVGKWTKPGSKLSTGYARWAEECSPDAEITYDTSWCNVMK